MTALICERAKRKRSGATASQKTPLPQPPPPASDRVARPEGLRPQCGTTTKDSKIDIQVAGEGGKRGSPKITLTYGVWMGASISYGTLLNALTHRSATVGTLLTASYMAAGLGHFRPLA